jgi:hypothetical protein
MSWVTGLLISLGFCVLVSVLIWYADRHGVNDGWSEAEMMSDMEMMDEHADY